MEIGILVGLMLVLVLGYLLSKSADLLENCFTYLGWRTGLRPLTIGFIIVGTTTSLPELFVAVNAVADDSALLSLGNIIGGTSLLLTVALGLAIYRKGGLKLREELRLSQLGMALLAIAFGYLSLADGQLTLLEAVIILVAYLLTTGYLFISSAPETKQPIISTNIQVPALLVVKAIIGLGGLVITSHLLVEQAIHLAQLLHVPAAIIGVTVLTLGTNLPELVLVWHGRSEATQHLAIGSMLGSAIAHTAILGILGILNSEHGPLQTDLLSVPILGVLVVLLIMACFAYTDRKITRWEALILIAIYPILLLIQVL